MGSPPSRRAHLRDSIPRVSYRPPPRTTSEEKSDAQVKRLLREQLDRLRHGGADVPAAARARTNAGVDGGGADEGSEAEAGCEEAEESGQAAKGEAGRPQAAQGQGQAEREEEEGGEQAPPLEHLDVTLRERLADGSGHLLETLPRYFLEPSQSVPCVTIA